MQWIALAVVGVGIGLLTGLSASPVLSVVLTSLVAAAATVTAIIGRYDGSDSTDGRPVPRPAPLALLVITILLGAIFGMSERINLAANRQAAHLRGLELAPPEDIENSITAWADLGLDRADVTQNLFDAYLGIVSAEAEKTVEQTAGAGTTGLFSLPSPGDCTRFRGIPDGPRLRTEMRAAASERWAAYADRIEDVGALRVIVDVDCELADEVSE